jgi:hypothetical protein
MRCWHAHVYPTPGIACWAAHRQKRAARPFARVNAAYACMPQASTYAGGTHMEACTGPRRESGRRCGAREVSVPPGPAPTAMTAGAAHSSSAAKAARRMCLKESGEEMLRANCDWKISQ